MGCTASANVANDSWARQPGGTTLLASRHEAKVGKAMSAFASKSKQHMVNMVVGSLWEFKDAIAIQQLFETACRQIAMDAVVLTALGNPTIMCMDKHDVEVDEEPDDPSSLSFPLRFKIVYTEKAKPITNRERIGVHRAGASQLTLHKPHRSIAGQRPRGCLCVSSDRSEEHYEGC